MTPPAAAAPQVRRRALLLLRTRPLPRAGLVLVLLSLALFALIAWALSQPPETFHALNPLTGAPIILHRGHSVRVPFDAAWILVGWREARAGCGALVVAGLLAVVLVSALPDGLRARPWTLRTWLGLGALGAVASLMFPVDYELNMLLGDGRTLPANVGGGRVFGAEIATSELMVGASNASAAMGIHDAVVAIRAVDALVAFMLVASTAALADGAAITARGRGLLFVGILICGASLQVMGYVETTVLELGAMALYAGAAARVLGHRHHGPSAPLLSWAALGLASVAHGAGALLLPSSVVLTMPRGRLGARRLLHHTLLFVTCVAVPFFLAVVPFWLRDDLGNADGGGDHIRFVPGDFDRVTPPSPVLYYGRFEVLHLADISNAMLLAAPLAPLVLLSLPWAGRAARPTSLVGLLATAAAFSLVIPLLWNHDFGMWGDWNLASTYLFPLHVASWVWLVQTMERFPGERTWATVIACAAMAVQLTGLAGLALQLY